MFLVGLVPSTASYKAHGHSGLLKVSGELWRWCVFGTLDLETKLEALIQMGDIDGVAGTWYRDSRSDKKGNR